MKKVILFLMVAFFAAAVFTSCEKDDPVLLSEYILGDAEWVSQEVEIDEDVFVWYSAVFSSNGTYYLSLTDGEESLDFDPSEYTVDDEANTISIQEPLFPDSDPPEVREWVTFNVTWNEDSDEMTWNPTGENNDAPILIWSRTD